MDYKLNNIYNEDCLEAMKRIPDNFFELAIVDPPYGINVTKMNMGGRKNVKPNEKSWDNEVPNKEYFDELFRVSRNQIIWGGNYFDLRPSRGFAVWDKGGMMYGRSFSECEYAWVSLDSSARIKRINPTQRNRFHPTQKPIELYSWLLSTYANEGDRILDTHVGSASSLIACHRLGYEFLGFELDKEYYDLAKERLDQERSQVMFDL